MVKASSYQQTHFGTSLSQVPWKDRSSNFLWCHLGCAVLSCSSHIRLFATPWNVAHQAPLSMLFSRQEYWSGLPFPSPGDLPNPGMELWSPTLQADSLPSELPVKPNNSRLILIRISHLRFVLCSTNFTVHILNYFIKLFDAYQFQKIFLQNICEIFPYVNEKGGPFPGSPLYCHIKINFLSFTYGVYFILHKFFFFFFFLIFSF